MNITYEFEKYLVEKAGVRSAEKRAEHLGYADIFVNEYLATVHPESFANQNNLTPDQIEEFIQGWFVVSEHLKVPEDILDVGKSLRHFLRFLADSGRIPRELKRELTESTEFKNFNEVFYPENSGEMDLDDESGEMEELFRSLSDEYPENVEKFFTDVQEKIEESDEIPPFFSFQEELKRLILEKNKGLFPLDETDMFVTGLIEQALEKSGFDPVVSRYDFSSFLMLHYKLLSIGWDEKLKPRNVIDFSLELFDDKRQEWADFLFGIADGVYGEFWFYEDDDLHTRLTVQFRKWMTLLDGFPANMWVVPREGVSVGKGTFEETARMLIRYFEDTARNVYPVYFLLLLCFGGLISFRHSDGKVTGLLKTRFGQWYFGRLAKLLNEEGL